MGRTETIRIALSKWPRERWPDPDRFEGYWEFRFKGYREKSVADAILAVKLESDPWLPTCEAVAAMLKEWGIMPAGKDKPGRAETDEQRSTRKEKATQPHPDDVLCKSLDDATFTRLAEQHVGTLEPDIARVVRSKPLRDRASVRQAVAALARMTGVVTSKVLESVL